MSKAAFTVLLLFLAACQTAGDITRHCAAVTSRFADQVSCINAYVAQNAALSGDSFVQEYLQAGRVLADKVAAGELTENEARLQLSRAYNDMITSQQRYNAYNAMEWQATRPLRTECRHVDSHIYCDTY